MSIFSALLVGCLSIDLETTFVTDPDIEREILSQSEDRFAHIEPLSLSAEITDLLDKYIGPQDRTEARVDKIQELLYSEDFLNISYSDRKTHTATEAYLAREGNCLSVMNLYVAMARYVGVDASFQRVQVQPSWDRRGNLLVLSQHINATGRLGVDRRYVVDFTPEIALQQLTSGVVSDIEARALYFNNLGVEALIAGELNEALIYFKNSLFLNPQQSITWNNIGATYNKLGNSRYAEYSYQQAFVHDDTNATAINNLVKYYRRHGNSALAREYEAAIQRFKNRNPYYHYSLGNRAFAANDMDRARRSYQRAVGLKESEPDFQFALSRVYLEMGNMDKARDIYDAANELLIANAEIYRPGDQRMRIIDSSSILRDSAPGISIDFARETYKIEVEP